MAHAVIMPKQGQSVETCIITKWFKLKGEHVNAGDILFSYETDKAAFDLESPADGTLLHVFHGEGAEVPVLENVALIGSMGEDISAFLPGEANGEKTAARQTSNVDKKLVPRVAEPLTPLQTGTFKTRISPRAKRLARNSGVNFTTIAGSGPNGRILYRDINKIVSGEEQTTPVNKDLQSEFTEKPLSNVRKLIARAMQSSLQNSAQLTHHMGADIRKVLEARKRIKDGLARGTEKQDITLNDMICWCVIRALLKFPDANSHYLNDRIRSFNRVHLGVAVDTPRGLMVPTVRNADEMDLVKLSKELKSVAESSKKGNISPELILSTSASFTVSNLGNYGVEMFTPVINLPQAAILGVCTIISRPSLLENNIFGFVPYIGLSLTYDHRAIDGGPATLFLREIKEQIENFSFPI